MHIKVIKSLENGKYLKSYVEEYPFVGWWYLTDKIEEAMVFRNTFHLIDVLRFLSRGGGKYIPCSVEFTNIKYIQVDKKR